MTSTVFHNGLVYSTVAVLLFCGATFADAQERQTLSVTPPLFQLSVVPGDVWQSSIKVVNGNSYPLTVYTEVANFMASGERGQGKFVPIIKGETEKTTLAHWINIARGPHMIDPEQTVNIPFFVEVPSDAPPGGHYAAVLVTTQPPSETGAMALKTTQAVTTLFFARIAGDVVESGVIREFRVLKSFLQKPEAEFSLRFENKGNVHLQPRGNIVITNMWGTERGVIPINYQTHFGNVLPESIRDFKFTWQSDFSITDVGRYTAEVTLGYGENGIQNITAVTSFWVIPVKITLITLAIIVCFILLIVWMVRMYVRKMLMLAGVDPNNKKGDSADYEERPTVVSRPERLRNSYQRVSAPLRSGVLDLRNRLDTVEESVDIIKTVVHFIRQYRIFFVSVCLLIAIFVSAVLYISKATEDHTNYRVIIDEGDSETTLEGSDIESE